MKSVNADIINQTIEPLSLSDMWNTILRRQKLIAVIVLSLLVLGFLFAQFSPKQYKAESVILIESQQKNLEIKSVLSEVPNDMTLIPSEIQVLISRNLMEKVLDALDIPNHPERLYQKKGQSTSSGEASKKMTEAQKKDLKENLISSALSQLEVKQIEKSRAISVSYVAKDPVLAAEIVNKLSDLYIEQQISNNFEAVRMTNSWLSERVDELQKKVRESEQKVADYRASAGLVDSRGSDLIEQNITDLSSKLTDAKAKLADTQSRLTEISNSKNLASAPSVLSSSLIQKLRESEADARNELASLSDKLGPGHPDITEARARVTEIQSKIGQEISRVAEGLRRENRTAQDNVALIEKQIDLLKKDYNSDKSDNVDLAALEREAETNRKFLETINLRWKETQSQEDSRLQAPYARIISSASVPNYPVSPNLKLILASVLFAGLGIGVGLALAFDQMQGTVYNGKQIQELTGLTNISLISNASLSGKTTASSNFADIPLHDSSSPYMEGVRELSAYLKLEKGKNASSKVFNFTSASEGEGKSSLVASLARQLALEGVRVVVVDCDVRQSTLSRIFGINDKSGLTDILRGSIQLRDGLVADSETSLSMISVGNQGDVNVMVQSPDAWQKTMDKLAQDFDMVLLDSPPILSAPEAKIIAKISNNVFCIRWKKTPLKLIGFALDTLKRAEAPMIGTVVTMAGGKIASGQSYQSKAA